MKLCIVLAAVLISSGDALLAVKNDACSSEDLKRREQLQNKLAGDCEEMCKEVGAYPKQCTCPGFVQPDSTPGVMTWDELLAHMDNLVAWGKDTLKGWTAQAAAAVLAQKSNSAKAKVASTLDGKACAALDLQHRAQMQNRLASACLDMCKEVGAYPKCECPGFAPPDSTPGVMTWEELNEHMDNLVAWGLDMLKKAKARASVAMMQQNRTDWKPDPCSEQPAGVPCTTLYKHPVGSSTVMPCPVIRQKNPNGCHVLFEGKADGTQCPQISCPKALGVTMKLVCSGGCCPTCWAPDHLIDYTREYDGKTVPPPANAPRHCKTTRCFPLVCMPGFTEGYRAGDCCYSCVPGL